MNDPTLSTLPSILQWADVETLVGIVADQVRAGGWMPDVIVAVARGGLVPAHMLAHRLDVREVSAVGVRFADRERTQERVYAVPSWPSGVPGRVLVVEDAVETGRLLSAAVARMPGEVRTAALLVSGASGVARPDFLGLVAARISRMPWELTS